MCIQGIMCLEVFVKGMLEHVLLMVSQDHIIESGGGSSGRCWPCVYIH
jgi:hypothetical protein